VIPVEVTQAPWHATGFGDWVDHWQTLIAGVLAFAAGFGTVAVTMIIARRQIAASREEANRVIAATRAQTDATFKQTEATIVLEDLRNACETRAFHAMLAAAMARVHTEAYWARNTYPDTLKQGGGASVDALAVRNCITKGAFAELRAACVRQGGPLTGEFLDLEREIDGFALQCEDRYSSTTGLTIRMGKLAGLGDQLTLIETKAAALLRKAAETFE